MLDYYLKYIHTLHLTIHNMNVIMLLQSIYASQHEHTINPTPQINYHQTVHLQDITEFTTLHSGSQAVQQAGSSTGLCLSTQLHIK